MNPLSAVIQMPKQSVNGSGNGLTNGSERPRRKKKATDKSTQPLKVRRPRNPDTRLALRNLAVRLIHEEYSYREALDLLRTYMLDSALRNAAGNKTQAGQRLGISREHVRGYHERGKELL